MSLLMGAFLLGGCIYKDLPDTTVAMDRALPKQLGTVLVVPQLTAPLVGAATAMREAVESMKFSAAHGLVVVTSRPMHDDLGTNQPYM